MSRPWTRRMALASVTVVALVAAIVSYAHMYELAARSGEGWRAWLFPLSVDGMLLAATLAIVDRRRVGLRAGPVPWAGLVLGIGASLVANVAAAEPTLTAQAVAAWPPVALAISIETLVIVLRNTATSAPTGPPPVRTVADMVAEVPVGHVDHQDAEPDPDREVPPDWWERAEPAPALPVVTPAPAPAVAEPEAPQGSDDRAAALIADGAGRRRLATELQISEHEARQLLDRARNGHHTAGVTG